MRQTSKKPRTALDKSTDLVYNTGMRNKKTLTKENEMKSGDLGFYQGSLVHVITVNKFWNEAVVGYVWPEGKQPRGLITVGLPRLKNLDKIEKRSVRLT